MKILLVEDNPLLGKSMKKGLEEAGWMVDLATEGQEGNYLTEVSAYDVIILDWMLPKLSGIDLLTSLRKRGCHTPTIMITAKSAIADRVAGLNKGADDYLVKPFEMVELIARVQAVYRRSQGVGGPTLKLGTLSIDLLAHEVSIAGQKVILTGKEFDLLAALASKMGQVINRDRLATMLYSLDDEPQSNSLDVLMTRLRKKIAGAGIEIITARGKGFMLRVEQATS